MGDPCTEGEAKPMSTVYYYIVSVPASCVGFLGLLSCAVLRRAENIPVCLLLKASLKEISSDLTLVAKKG